MMEKGKRRLVLPPLALKQKDTEEHIRKEQFQDFVIKHHVKTLGVWFNMWQHWQRRIMICEVMNHCTRQLLKQLATSMEPVLHIDFSTTLLPPLQALHLQGTAKFQVLRCITKRVAKPEILTEVSSQDYLDSLPSTFETGPTKSSRSDKNRSRQSQKQKEPKIKRAKAHINIQPVEPVLPLVHPRHISSQSISNDASTSIRNLTTGDFRKRFNSVPEFKQASGQLKNVIDRENEERKCGKVASSIAPVPPLLLQRKTDIFQDQLLQVTNWMKSWEQSQKFYLLNQIVKFCDKDLLGYFVQCLHQRIVEMVTIDALPDSVLLNIFSYLEASDLCRMSRVCRRWNDLCSQQFLWKRRTQKLGKTLGMHDMTLLIETVANLIDQENKRDIPENEDHEVEDEEEAVEVDWKRAYRQLWKLMCRMREVATRRASISTEAQENLLIKKMELAIGKTAHAHFTLIEMLDILRAKCSSPLIATTYDLVQTAPMRPEALRQMRREMEKELALTEAAKTKEKEESAMKEDTDGKEDHEEQKELMQGKSSLSEKEQLDEGQHKSSSSKQLGKEEELLSSALDLQAKAPQLPDIDGIKCLILAGGLRHGLTPRPGRLMSISRTRRIRDLKHVVTCLQSDLHKIVMGTSDRSVVIVDIRTGRRLCVLQGHKGSIQCLQFDDFKIVSGSWDCSCIVWDIVNHKFLKQLHGHTDTISCLQFDGDILVTGSFDGSLRVWSTSSWETLSIIGAAHLGGVTSMRLSNQVIISGGHDQSVKIWCRDTYHCLSTFSHQSPIATIGLSKLLLVSCSLDGMVIFWSLDTFKSVMRRRLNHDVHIKQIVSSQNKFYGATSGGTVLELDVCTGTCMRTLVGHSRSLTAIWLSEHRLVTAAADNSVVVWYFKKAMELEVEIQQRNIFKNITRDELDFLLEPIPICTAKADLFEMLSYE